MKVSRDTRGNMPAAKAINPAQIEMLKRLADQVQKTLGMDDEDADAKIGYDPGRNRLILAPSVVEALLKKVGS